MAKVLVVTADEKEKKIFRAELTRHNYEFDIVSSVGEAIEALHTAALKGNDYQAVLSDYTIGSDTIQKLDSRMRQQSIEVPVVLVDEPDMARMDLLIPLSGHRVLGFLANNNIDDVERAINHVMVAGATQFKHLRQSER